MLVPDSILGIFRLFFTLEIMEYIVKETNNYAVQCLGQPGCDSWELVTVPELEAFFGFMLLMGIVKLPSLHHYWSQDPVFHYLPVASRISRARFLDIAKYLHFADNGSLAPSGTPEYDRLGKINPILNQLGERFRSVYNLHKEVSIDEAMIPFKGRSTMKQYLPLKPIKRGFKVWMLADAQTGYVSRLDVYKGKDKGKSEDALGESVVKNLCQDIHMRYHHAYFDNFFTSMKLLLDLAKVGIYGCGTLRSNRVGFPSDLKPFVKSGLSTRGEFLVRQCERAEGENWIINHKQSNRLSVYLWQDNRPVVIGSTNCNPLETTTVRRRQKDGTQVEVSCPTSISLYNKYMGGVDRNDQLRGYYNVRLKGRKFYKYIWWFLFDVVVTNSYILAKHHSTITTNTVVQFRKNLAESLIANFNNRKRRGRPSITSVAVRPFSSDHFPQKAENRGRCYFCYHHRRERHETFWYCNLCKKHLCHDGKSSDCYLLYHQSQPAV